ncbi:MAG: ParB/RepB/Spo0J family partition protein [Sedimentisphaerales bacterium]|nr:ParB/RepB/Spo0J family partition protein [Sedimentisphaerales bacterium]
MMKKEKRPHLGRGLESLLGPICDLSPVDGDDMVRSESVFIEDMELQASCFELSVEDLIPNPYQPRVTWNPEELSDLSKSIQLNGVIQPILVRKRSKGYEIIAGERRFRAAKEAGLSKVPVIVRQANDEQMLELALIENIHRTDLNPIERAFAYKNYLETFSVTQTEAADRLGEDRTVISNHIRLLELPSDVKQMLIEGKLSMGHARAILSLPSDELRKKLANRAMAGRLSVREVERIVRLTLAGSQMEQKNIQKDPNITDLERQLQETLGTRVQILTRKRSQKGRIIIDFYSLDDFDRLTRRMGLAETESV